MQTLTRSLSQPVLTSWLELMCRMLPRVSAAAFYPADPEATPVAWPESAPAPELYSLVALAREQTAPVVVDKAETQQLLLAKPLEIDSQPFGVIAVNLDASGRQREVVLQLLGWGEAWLQLLVQQTPGEAAVSEAANTAPELVEALLRPLDLQTAMLALVSEIAERLHASRVSLGICRDDGIELAALSHQVEFDARLNLAGMMQAAMDEAALRGIIVQVDASTDNIDLPAHQLLLQHVGAHRLLTVPLVANDNVVAVLLLYDPEAAAAADQLEPVAPLLASVLALRLASAPGPLSRLTRPVSAWLTALTERGHHVTKMISAAVVLALVLVTLIPAEYRVTAEATLEGKTQRAVVAPFDGFIAESSARAGDRVIEGDLLGHMDDRDLKLELRQVTGERDELTREYRQALADMNPGEARITRSRVEQVESRWQLLQHRLEQVELRAPFDGVVLTGDLSRSEGAPVTRGELLFEIAPLSSYRVVLHIDEADVNEISPGQMGEVVLAAHPDRQIAFTVDSVTSVIQSERDLGVVFRAEASLNGDFDFLRPGMEGVARVSAGDRTLFWILFHDLVDWVRLTAWRWLP